MKHYTQGSQAMEEQEWWGEVPARGDVQQGRQKRPARRIENIPTPVKSVNYAKRAERRREQQLSTLLFALTLALAFAFVSCHIIRYVRIMDNTKQINALSAQIREAESDHANLELRLEARKDLRRVKEAALAMGMAYPKEGQVRVVALGNTGVEQQTQMVANTAD